MKISNTGKGNERRSNGKNVKCYRRKTNTPREFTGLYIRCFGVGEEQKVNEGNCSSNSIKQTKRCGEGKSVDERIMIIGIKFMDIGDNGENEENMMEIIYQQWET